MFQRYRFDRNAFGSLLTCWKLDRSNYQASLASTKSEKRRTWCGPSASHACRRAAAPPFGWTKNRLVSHHANVSKAPNKKAWAWARLGSSAQPFLNPRHRPCPSPTSPRFDGGSDGLVLAAALGERLQPPSVAARRSWVLCWSSLRRRRRSEAAPHQSSSSPIGRSNHPPPASQPHTDTLPIPPHMHPPPNKQASRTWADGRGRPGDGDRWDVPNHFRAKTRGQARPSFPGAPLQLTKGRAKGGRRGAWSGMRSRWLWRERRQRRWGGRRRALCPHPNSGSRRHRSPHHPARTSLLFFGPAEQWGSCAPQCGTRGSDWPRAFECVALHLTAEESGGLAFVPRSGSIGGRLRRARAMTMLMIDRSTKE